uniref:U3 small nucleolar ribonucleoprotein protein IMP3 n=1 Tax=Scapholeberis mucronata TaxID=202097 RepID=A0A4Y7NKL6_9CRUS|nr:EOG090X0APJ [Scapholeberis mucronata]SVE93789.1 EOG090X0APJ [Scapholeberis mucronata]
MVRKLKFHEQKLLKKVDFISWKLDNNIHEVKILKRYKIQKRDDYSRYCKITQHIQKLATKIKDLDPTDPFRIECSASLLEKLYSMGLIQNKWSLDVVKHLSASCFCRRRLPVVMVRSKMADSITTATKFVEQGHVRVGPEVVKDPAFLVTRNMEDFVTWVDSSAIKKHIMEYNEMRDDFNMA